MNYLFVFLVNNTISHVACKSYLFLDALLFIVLFYRVFLLFIFLLSSIKDDLDLTYSVFINIKCFNSLLF